MKELRGDSDTFGRDWGLFSRGIPGRVGYQCSTFYRSLIESGELTDSRYIRCDDGRLHHASRIHGSAHAPPVKKRVVRRLEISQIESIRLVCRAAGFVREETDEVDGKSRYEVWAMQNPLPDTLDLITGEVMRVPAISPDGYVLDYKTWVDSLAEKPVNPFTQTKLTKRQLVILTTENIDEYAHKIVNLTCDQ
jgi:hypothetical protein